jgi:hypothetical protein
VAVVLGRGGSRIEVARTRRDENCAPSSWASALLGIHKSSSGLPGSEVAHHMQETCWIAAELSLCPELLIRPHPKRHDRSNQQDRNAAEKRKSPVSGLVDHVSEYHWRNDRGERRTDIHEAAGGS